MCRILRLVFLSCAKLAYVNKIVDRLSMAFKNLVAFKRTNWTDTSESGTALTASQLNRVEKAVEDLTTSVNTLLNEYYYTVLYSNEGWYIYHPSFEYKTV